MRIAFLGDGSLGHVRRWVGYFHSRGHEVLLVTFEDAAPCDYPVRGIHPRLPTKLLGYLSSLGEVREAIGSFDPEIVNALYVTGYGLVGALCGRAPLVVSALGSDLLVDYRAHLVHRLQTRFTLGRAQLVTVDAENLAEIAVSIGVPRGRIVTAYFGVDEGIFRPRDDASLSERAKPPNLTVVSTRNLHPVYDVGTFIVAAAILSKQLDVHFMVCGDGPERDALEKSAMSLGVKARTTFTGGLEPAGIARALREAHVYVSTSLSDSTSVSLLEAMASGAVPVVTDIPANREWIENGVNGFLFPPGHAAELAETLYSLLQDWCEKDIPAIRRRNLDIVTRRGLWRANMERIEDAFKRLLEEPR